MPLISQQWIQHVQLLFSFVGFAANVAIFFELGMLRAILDHVDQSLGYFCVGFSMR
jgi:hypothetical protein